MVNKKIQLQDDGTSLFPLAMLNGIDTSNVIESVINRTYSDYHNITINQDCYVCITNDGYGHNVKIDGIIFEEDSDTSTIVPLKKGQVLSIKSGFNAGHQAYSKISYTLYDIKR